VAASEFRAEGLRCAACHPDHDEVATDSHGDGQVDVRFDETLAGADASYDPGSRTCAVACHDRGGQVPRPTWDDIGPRECGDCHPSPPDDHPSGACTLCHREADEEGEAIEPGPFHVNGVADLGDGSGLCGACHGVLDDPSPSTERHPAHLSPTSTEPIPCEACHVRPEEVDDPGHLDDDLPGAEVTFGGVATARGATPVLDDLTCRSVACHGEGLIGEPERSLRWDDTSGAPGACGACHGLPPAPPHGPYDACQSMFCHGGEVTRSGDSLGITPSGRAIHIDGVIDSGGGGG
jgi:predicted CxxxxCH...CXXCH cytochrome family protein